jgi:hypothetical protein
MIIHSTLLVSCRVNRVNLVVSTTKIPDLSSSTASATSLGWPKRLASVFGHSSVGDWKLFLYIFGTFLLGTVEYEPGMGLWLKHVETTKHGD